MNNIKVNLIAFPGAEKELFEKGEEIIKSKLYGINANIIFNDQNPDILFVLTGGSENEAKAILSNVSQVLILAITENNSYAASTEIKAYCNQKGIRSLLYNIDNEDNIKDILYNYLTCKEALKRISNYQIGLIGNVSEWLIASDIDNGLIKKKLGVKLEKISWKDFPGFSEFPVNSKFINHFRTTEYNLEDSSRVYNLINEIKKTKRLDAITVECFPLVRNYAVTACLALSKFNSEGLPAGCEGDITSIIGKIIIKELTGQIPWMANLAGVENNQVFLAHCTIDTNLVSSYSIKTHFETNLGTAIQGQFSSDHVTIFRLNNKLNKAFISCGKVVERPERDDACRTQIKVQIPDSDIIKLKENPLGNHHLIFPGDNINMLITFCLLAKIDIV